MRRARAHRVVLCARPDRPALMWLPRARPGRVEASQLLAPAVHASGAKASPRLAPPSTPRAAESSSRLVPAPLRCRAGCCARLCAAPGAPSMPPRAAASRLPCPPPRRTRRPFPASANGRDHSANGDRSGSIWCLYFLIIPIRICGKYSHTYPSQSTRNCN
jgi:hypothetical protein